MTEEQSKLDEAKSKLRKVIAPKYPFLADSVETDEGRAFICSVIFSHFVSSKGADKGGDKE